VGWFPKIVLLLVILRLAARLALDALNRKEILRNAIRCPDALAGVMEPASYARSVQYSLAKGRLASVSAAYGGAVLPALLFGGCLPLLWARMDGLAPGEPWSGALFLVAAMILIGLLGLPLDWWSQFRLEESFGFNKSTLGLWVVDHIKLALLGVGIGFPIAWGLLAMARRVGAHWWIWGFAILFGFQMAMMVLYPKLILPLFNKLSPLPDGDLRTRLMALSDRAGFRAKTIETMDGSKRSGHSNAFFTGFGRFRRIVLFDTLMAQLAPEELEAVLAHEIGHYKCGHVPKFIALSAVFQFGAFGVAAWLAKAPWFNTAFGLPGGSLAPTLLLVGLLGGLVTFWLAPAGSWLSRRNEYEADAFARKAMGSGGPLIGALRKLSRNNLSNLTPHPLYSVVYYSHPTLLEREFALKG
jgi:STE24 endopeptidase